MGKAEFTDGGNLLMASHPKDEGRGLRVGRGGGGGGAEREEIFLVTSCYRNR